MLSLAAIEADPAKRRSSSQALLRCTPPDVPACTIVDIECAEGGTGAPSRYGGRSVPGGPLERIGAIGGQPFNTAPYLALEAADIVRQRGVGITGQVKQAQLAESFGAQVHGGDPQVILAVANDPLYECVGGLAPRPPEEQLDYRGTVVVEDGHLSMAWRPVRPPEPD